MARAGDTSSAASFNGVGISSSVPWREIKFRRALPNQARVMCAYGVAGKKPLSIPRQAIIHQLIRLRINRDDNLRPNRNAGAR